MNIIERLKEEKIAVHCDTKEKSNELLRILQDNGFVWRSGCELTFKNYYIIYQPDTCYAYDVSNKGVVFCGKQHFIEHHYSIITFYEFVNEYNKKFATEEKVKLTKFEYDLLDIVSGERHGFKYGHIQFKAMGILVKMKEKGHFKDVDVEMTIEEILNNCEVVNEKI